MSASPSKASDVTAAKVTVRTMAGSGLSEARGVEAARLPVSGEWVWVDVEDPDPATLERLGLLLGLHPLAVEDASKPQARPKLDLYGDAVFLVWLSPHVDGEGRLATSELDCFLAPGLLVTSHAGRIDAVSEVAADAARVMRRGPDWLLHGILDRMADSLLPVADAVGDALEDVEDRMLGEPHRSDLELLYALRRRLLLLHRLVAPQRDIVRALARERDFVSEEAYRYFDDVADHLTHVEEALETYRDIGSAVMDIYLSAQSNRLNEVMKLLTVVTVIIGASTLISGIYGMNLLAGMWPGPTARWGFPLVIVAMVAVSGAMSYYFRRKNWW